MMKLNSNALLNLESIIPNIPNQNFYERGAETSNMEDIVAIIIHNNVTQVSQKLHLCNKLTV